VLGARPVDTGELRLSEDTKPEIRYVDLRLTEVAYCALRAHLSSMEEKIAAFEDDEYCWLYSLYEQVMGEQPLEEPNQISKDQMRELLTVLGITNEHNTKLNGPKST